MKSKHLLICCALLGLVSSLSAAPTPSDPGEIPLVCEVENTGSNLPRPLLPALVDLPVVGPLTDPFMWSETDPHNWSDPAVARSTDFSDWSRRRAQIAWEIQHYEIGEKPAVAREQVEAFY